MKHHAAAGGGGTSPPSPSSLHISSSAAPQGVCTTAAAHRICPASIFTDPGPRGRVAEHRSRLAGRCRHGPIKYINGRLGGVEERVSRDFRSSTHAMSHVPAGCIAPRRHNFHLALDQDVQLRDYVSLRDELNLRVQKFQSYSVTRGHACMIMPYLMCSHNTCLHLAALPLTLAM